MTDPHPDRTAAERQVTQLELVDRLGENAKLAAAVKSLAKNVNSASSGYKALEWLGMLGNTPKWAVGKVWRGAVWAARRLSGYEKRLAEAAKIRAEGKATVVAAEATAELTVAKAATQRAKARQEEAKARSLEIKNETAEELLRQLRARGIDLAADVRDGQLRVAVVKEPSALPPADPETDSAPTPKPRRKRKPRDKPKSGDTPVS